MLLASIIIAACALALGLLTMLERYENSASKMSPEEPVKRTATVAFYDAFARQESAPEQSRAKNRSTSRQSAA